ncbi:hypothetical protein FGB62_139g216 [Gracilaria domingensis]|nr:hypothetical protein FGB62_139g216 [Gracilaria domingensis]
MFGRLDPVRQHEMSERGDWLYGEADRFDDVFAPAGMDEYADAPIQFLMALCIVKLRIVARMNARTPPQPLEAAQSYYPNRAPDHLLILQRYFDAVHRRNPSVLPALVNPEPLRNGPVPMLKQFGGPSEAYFALLSCYELLVAIPGAVDMLIRRFGPNPQYEHRDIFNINMG